MLLRDPLIQLLLAAMLLATLAPVTGSAHDIAQGVSNAAVFVLFVLFGLRISRAEVLAGLSNRRLLLPLLGWVFGAMTAAGWVLWHPARDVLPPLIALGFLYLGVLPSTIQSATVYSSLAGGNLAASVVAAAVVNVVGVVISAPLFSLLAGTAAAGFQGGTLLKIVGLLLVPFVVGQVLQHRLGGWAREHKSLLSWVDRGSIAIAVYVAFSGAVEQGIWTKVDGASWLAVGAGCAVFLAFGYGGAWLAARSLGLSRADRITFLFAGAQKSVAMGAPLATVLFPGASAGLVLVPLLIYHLAQMVVAAPIAARLGCQAQPAI